MRPLPAARLSRAVVACYPPRWKQRYREEMLEVLDQHQASSRTVLSLAGGALTAHLDPSYRMGRPVIKNKAVRALLIAAAGCLTMIALAYGVFTYTDVNQLIGDLVWHPGHAEGDVALVLTPDQRLLATLEGGEPDTAVVTLMSVGPAGLRQLSSFEGGVTVAIAPDGHLVATSGYGGEAALWNVARPRYPALLAILRPGSSNALWGEAFSPDSKLLAAAYGGTTALWDVARPAEPRLLTVLDAHVGVGHRADVGGQHGQQPRLGRAGNIPQGGSAAIGRGQQLAVGREGLAPQSIGGAGPQYRQQVRMAGPGHTPPVSYTHLTLPTTERV